MEMHRTLSGVFEKEEKADEVSVVLVTTRLSWY